MMVIDIWVDRVALRLARAAVLLTVGLVLAGCGGQSGDTQVPAEEAATAPSADAAAPASSDEPTATVEEVTTSAPPVEEDAADGAPVEDATSGGTAFEGSAVTDDAADQAPEPEQTAQALDNLIITFSWGSPVVSVFEASGDLRHTVEFDAQRVVPFYRSYGSRTVVLVDRGSERTNSVVLFDAATGESQEISQINHRPGNWFTEPYRPGIPNSGRWLVQLNVERIAWEIGDPVPGQTPWVAVNMATGDTIRPTDAGSDSVPYMSEDESGLAYVRSDGSVWHIDTTSFTETKVETGNRSAVPGLALSPDGSLLAWVSSTNSTIYVTNLETSQVAQLDTAARAADWVTGNLLLSKKDGKHALFDGRSGEFLSFVHGVSEHYSFSYLGSGVGVQEAERELLTVVNFVTGDVEKHAIPARTYFSIAPAPDGGVIWGSTGGRNGGLGQLAGWMVDLASGSVTTFEHPVSSEAFYTPESMALSPDLAHAALAVDGTLFEIDRDGTVVPVTDGIKRPLALCPNGDLVVRRDDDSVDVLDNRFVEVLATIELASEAVCVVDAPK